MVCHKKCSEAGRLSLSLSPEYSSVHQLVTLWNLENKSQPACVPAGVCGRNEHLSKRKVHLDRDFYIDTSEGLHSAQYLVGDEY